MRISIGCDPELFVFSMREKKYISAHGMVSGTKENPLPVDRGAVQVDGTALEFNIEPAFNREVFVYNINHVRTKLRHMLQPIHVPRPVPTVIYTEEEWKAIPDHAKMLGCEPDYNAWTGQINPKPDCNSLMRTAAGHIHVGWTKDQSPFEPDHFENCQAVVKQLDYYLGMNSLRWDTDNKRRSLYGKAGAFRPKPYGVEYRVLSNRWLVDDMLMGWIFDTTKKAVEDMTKGKVMTAKHGPMAQMVIDNNATDWADRSPDVWKDMGLMPVPHVAREAA
jgi:phiEco32-like amidoligase-type 2 protein